MRRSVYLYLAGGRTMDKKSDRGREQKRVKYLDKVHAYGTRYAEFDWPSVELVLNFISSFSLLTDILGKKLAEYGLSRAGFNVLMILSRSEGKICKHCEIGRLMFVSRANITGLVDCLARQKLVERRRDPGDRRVWLVAITGEGESLLKKLLPDYFQKVRECCLMLSDKEKKKVNQLLCRWRAGLYELDDKKI